MGRLLGSPDLRRDRVRTRLQSSVVAPFKGCTGNFSHVQISIMKPSGSWKNTCSMTMPFSSMVFFSYLISWSCKACSTFSTESLCPHQQFHDYLLSLHTRNQMTLTECIRIRNSKHPVCSWQSDVPSIKNSCQWWHESCIPERIGDHHGDWCLLSQVAMSLPRFSQLAEDGYLFRNCEAWFNPHNIRRTLVYRSSIATEIKNEALAKLRQL